MNTVEFENGPNRYFTVRPLGHKGALGTGSKLVAPVALNLGGILLGAVLFMWTVVEVWWLAELTRDKEVQGSIPTFSKRFRENLLLHNLFRVIPLRKSNVESLL